MSRLPGSFDVRRSLILVSLAAALAALGALIAASSGSARAKPKCFGQTATIVGTNGPNHISGTARKDVIVALGGDDTIETKNVKRNHGNDVICGNGGGDKIQGNADTEKIIGGPGNDTIAAGNGNDLVVGDNANPNGNESGPTGRDDLAGSGGSDFMVGDNWATGNVSGGASDINFRAAGGGDTVVGDSASAGNGNASGGGNDRLGGADGNDIVIGDSYANTGNASGGGNDDNNSGPGKDLAVGDSYSKSGMALIGGGTARDELQAADGGDFGNKCKPEKSACPDVFYGDGFVASCGKDATIAAIRCQANRAPGGGYDRLTPDRGNDFMNGGAPDPDGRGTSVDRCSGGAGVDTATRCKGIQTGFEHEIPFP